MTPDAAKVAQCLADAAMANGGPAPDVNRLESALGRIAKQQAATLCRDAGALLAALEAKPLEVTQTSDPYGFIIVGVSVHNFSGDPDFSDDPRRDWLWGYYLVGSDWTAGFATMMDAARAGRAALLGDVDPAELEAMRAAALGEAT